MTRRKTRGPGRIIPGQRGGWRPGAGRKPTGDKSGVPHQPRGPHSARHPVLVIHRLKKDLPSLRTGRVNAALQTAFTAGRERGGFRLVHYSVQRDELYMIVEAKDARALARGMQGLLIRVARAANRVWGRLGSIFADRFESRVLCTPKEVRDALVFVLNHDLLRGEPGRPSPNRPDPYSSGQWFDGWREDVATQATEAVEDSERPVMEPRTELLTKDWRRHGLLSVQEAPPGGEPPGER